MSVVRSIPLFSITRERAIRLVRVRSVACQTYRRGRNALQRAAPQKSDRPSTVCDLFASAIAVDQVQSTTTNRTTAPNQ
ncbi:MAG: hypothetical protein MUO62_10290, partial [Anaerolineales bacterium]|nr:hypothetical protein [Anaerolineales bacterium]